MLILILIVTVVAFSCLKIHLHKNRLLKNLKHVPTLKGYPLIGLGYRFIGKSTTGIYNELVEISSVFQKPSMAWFGPTLLIIVSRAEDMKAVLTSPHCLQKPYVYEFLNVSAGLVAADVHIWKPHRKLLNPTFNHKILASFIPIFNEKSKIMANNLEQLVGQKEPFDISEQFFACTLDMVCATSFGCDFGCQTKKNHDILHAFEKVTDALAERIWKLWHHWDFIFAWSQLCKIQTKSFNTIERLTKEIYRIKKEEFNETKSNSNITPQESDDFKEPQIFVNEVLRLQSAGMMDDRMVLDQILTMLFAGYETCALTASHVILMLAMHHDIQEKVFQEIKSAHSSQHSDTDAEAMTNLNYLVMVIRETMRLLPVAPFLARECTDDVKISNCTIPKGSMILLAFHVLHRDKSVWGPNPEKFNPEHFLPEKIAQRHPFSYLPFSGGPRNCIGIKYGWMSLKIMLSTLLRRYKFTTDIKFEELVVKWGITLKIVNRNWVRIEPRIY